MAQYHPNTLIELGKQYLQIAGNPKTRKTVLKAHKEVFPNARFADVEMDELKEQNAALKAELKMERETEKVNERLEKQRETLLAKYTPEQVKEIETTVMEKHGISDYEVAAKVYAADLKPSMDSDKKQALQSMGATWTFPELPGLMDDPAKAAREAAFATIDEINRAKR